MEKQPLRPELAANKRLRSLLSNAFESNLKPEYDGYSIGRKLQDALEHETLTVPSDLFENDRLDISLREWLRDFALTSFDSEIQYELAVRDLAHVIGVELNAKPWI